MIELNEIECCILINALNKKINDEQDTEDYSSIFNKLQGELDLNDYEDSEIGVCSYCGDKHPIGRGDNFEWVEQAEKWACIKCLNEVIKND